MISDLWNDDLHEGYEDCSVYLDHILAQYRIYVESADRISSRRGTANTFFSTACTMIIGIITYFSAIIPGPALILFCIAAIAMCIIWKRMIRSYGQLNRAKYLIIGELEKVLPASPFVAGEWSALDEGRDPRVYTPLTSVEKWVPFLFICLYGFLAALIIIELLLSTPI